MAHRGGIGACPTFTHAHGAYLPPVCHAHEKGAARGDRYLDFRCAFTSRCQDRVRASSAFGEENTGNMEGVALRDSIKFGWLIR